MDQVSQTDREEHARTVYAEARAAVLRLELGLVDMRRRLEVAKANEGAAAAVIARMEGRSL